MKILYIYDICILLMIVLNINNMQMYMYMYMYMYMSMYMYMYTYIYIHTYRYAYCSLPTSIDMGIEHDMYDYGQDGCAAPTADENCLHYHYIIVNIIRHETPSQPWN